MAKKVIITLFSPHKVQKKILKALYDPEVYFVSVCAGRRLGKSLFNINVACKFALENDNAKVLIVTPSADQRDVIWNDFLRLFEKAPFINKMDRTMKDIYIGNNSIIKFRLGSFPAAESLRGNAFDMIIIDEATMIDEALWTEILMPTLATSTKKPKVLFTSTPKSAGDWFYKQYQYGLDPDMKEYRSIHAPSSSSPYVNLNFLEQMKKALPPNIYRQEIEAEFLSDSGALFENINNCIRKFPRSFGSRRFAGIDVGVVSDYTVVTVIDEFGNMIDYLRFNQLDLKSAARRIADFLIKNGSPMTYIETNAYSSLIDYITELGYKKIYGFNTNSKSKGEIIDDLCVVFANEEINLIDDKYLVSEFFAFTYNYNIKTRNITYSAPSGLFDDIVLSTAIAFKARKDMKHKTLKYSFT